MPSSSVSILFVGVAALNAHCEWSLPSIAEVCDLSDGARFTGASMSGPATIQAGPTTQRIDGRSSPGAGAAGGLGNGLGDGLGFTLAKSDGKSGPHDRILAGA